MSRILLPLLLVAAAVGAYFLFLHEGSDTAGDGTGLEADDGSPKPGDAKDEREGKKGASLDTAPKAPADVKPQNGQLQVAANVLMVAKLPGQWQSFMEIVFEAMDDLSFRTWYLHVDGQEGGRAGPGRGMTALEAKPTAAYLEDNDVRALFLDFLDPNAFPADFWETVARRVRSGSMGLWFRPGVPSMGERMSSQHPALSHPVLSQLLPVASAPTLDGDKVPGVYDEPQKLVLTADGAEHPATRLVPDKDNSRKVWAAATAPEGLFATRFCYPVERLKPGAKSLMEVDALTAQPAILVSAPEVGRVMWMGNIDFGNKTYFDRAGNTLQKMAFSHAVVWLVGQAR